MSYVKLKKQLLECKFLFESLNVKDFDFQFDIKEENNWLKIGVNNMGSTIVAITVDNEEENNYLFVWLDGEAAFNLVFATDFIQFIKLYPYINGMLYDILFNWDLFNKFPKIFPNPENNFTFKSCKKYLDENFKEYPFLIDFYNYYKEKFTITKIEYPYKIILEAINSNKGFNNWYENLKKE